MIREGQYVIGFMGAMPPEAAKLLSEFPADYVAMTNLGFSLQDVAALSESIVESVQHNAPGASLEIVPGALSSQITVSVDPSTVPDIDTAAVSIPSRTSTDQRIANVSVDVSSATLTAQDSQRLQALASVLALPNNGTLQVTITARTEEMPAPVVSIVGGGSLSNCTAGFTAISSSGVLGVLTAGHCGQSEIYANATGLTYLGSTFGTNGDFAFFRTIPSNNDTVTKTFRASSATDLRTQTASKDPLVGDTL
ncbi:MAG: S1 family peptidase [Propionibacteriaceae bacterium]|nr:S1 family peptidase [Propionibacteriaceae bacterium]